MGFKESSLLIWGGYGLQGKSTPKTQHTRKREYLVVPRICDFGCVAFSGVFWRPLRGEQRALENATRPNRRVWPVREQLVIRVFECVAFLGVFWRLRIHVQHLVVGDSYMLRGHWISFIFKRSLAPPFPPNPHRPDPLKHQEKRRGLRGLPRLRGEGESGRGRGQDWRTSSPNLAPVFLLWTPDTTKEKGKLSKKETPKARKQKTRRKAVEFRAWIFLAKFTCEMQIISDCDLVVHWSLTQVPWSAWRPTRVETTVIPSSHPTGCPSLWDIPVQRAPCYRGRFLQCSGKVAAYYSLSSMQCTLMFVPWSSAHAPELRGKGFLPLTKIWYDFLWDPAPLPWQPFFWRDLRTELWRTCAQICEFAIFRALKTFGWWHASHHPVSGANCGEGGEDRGLELFGTHGLAESPLPIHSIACRFRNSKQHFSLLNDSSSFSEKHMASLVSASLHPVRWSSLSLILTLRDITLTIKKSQRQWRAC